MTAEQLAGRHWEYIESLLEQHGIEETNLEGIGFHYVTAFVHGFKHGQAAQEAPCDPYACGEIGPPPGLYRGRPV